MEVGSTSMYYVIKKVRYSDGDTYLVVKTSRPNVAMLRGFRARTYYLNYTSINLNDLVRRSCIDTEFEQHMNRFLSESEFKELITSYINKCFKSEDVKAKRLKRLEEFLSNPVKERKRRKLGYLVVVDGAPDELLTRNAVGAVDLDKAYLYLFKRGFCVVAVEYLVGRFTVFLPYDVKKISADVVVRLNKKVINFLKDVAAEIERRNVDTLRDVLNVIKHTIELYEA